MIEWIYYFGPVVREPGTEGMHGRARKLTGQGARGGRGRGRVYHSFLGDAPDDLKTSYEFSPLRGSSSAQKHYHGTKPLVHAPWEDSWYPDYSRMLGET